MSTRETILIYAYGMVWGIIGGLILATGIALGMWAGGLL